MTRFRITYHATPWKPWHLDEWQEPLRWFQRGFWQRIGYADTKGELETQMKAIVEGERQIEPAYYDHRGGLDCSW